MCFRRVVSVVLLVLTAAPALAVTMVPVGDPAYDSLRRLEAEGVIETGLLHTLPLGRPEVLRLVTEAERHAEGRGPAVQEEIRYLRERLRLDLDGSKYLRPVDDVRATYIHSEDTGGRLSYNNDGDHYASGSSGRVAARMRAEFGWIAGEAEPELTADQDGWGGRLRSGYGVLGLGTLALTGGKQSQWWGPGYHGAILLSNNAEPLTMVRLENTRPYLLPWVFSGLGPVRFSTFVSRLEHDRDYPHPYLWGLRVEMRPAPYLDIGLSRTAILGGEGRDTSGATWWDSLWGRNENNTSKNTGDQRAGGDLTITVPWGVQPFQVYLEAAGEDSCGGWPCEWAYLGGIHLPRVLGLGRLSLRGEYATTRGQSGWRSQWYEHYIYTSGYTYNGDIIGHHMGSDADDLFVEASYLFPEMHGTLRLSYDRERHDLMASVHAVKDEVAASLGGEVTGHLSVCLMHRMAWFRNTPGADTANLTSIGLKYTF